MNNVLNKKDEIIMRLVHYFITEENHDKFSEYKYTFTKTKNGNYKFVSIEKVK